MSATPPSDGRPRPPGSSPAPAEFVPAGEVGDDEITRNLKRAYQEVAAEPIPEALLALLAKLDATEGTPGDDV